MKPLLNINMGAMFDFSPQPRDLDVAPAHYIDYHPEETQRQVDMMMTWLPTPQGELDLKVTMGKLREFVEGCPKTFLFEIDSFSPLT